MRVAIVEDESADREKIARFLRDYAAEMNILLDMEEFVSGDELMSRYKKIFDIIIFDVDMPGTNGMDTARRIREADSQVAMLFVTNMAQYAINGYEVDAVDYMIKPVGYYDFVLKFKKAVAKAAQSKSSYVYLEMPDGMRRMPVAEIAYVEVMRHYLIYHADGECYKVRGSMKEHEHELAAYNFCRIHRSYLVNLAAVEEISAAQLRIGEDTLPVGRAYKSHLLLEYMKYVRGQ